MPAKEISAIKLLTVTTAQQYPTYTDGQGFPSYLWDNLGYYWDNALDNAGTIFGYTMAVIFNMIFNVIIEINLFIISSFMTLLIAVIDTKNYTELLNSEPVQKAWIVIRDVLNMFFILLLLFSAFATIFQVEKFHIKKVLLMVVLMALLVNFSFPISRFIIDAANMPMYYMLQETGGPQDVAVKMLDDTNLKKILVPDAHWSDKHAVVLYASAAIFSFILMVTIVVIAFLFLIRLVALVLLVIFSPVGFVAAIFPATRKLSDQWWQNIIKYSFFGPIMIFMLLISLYLMAAFSDEIKDNISQVATNNLKAGGDSTATGSFVTNLVYGMVPIVVLWMGLLSAQKIGVAGADIAISKAKGFSKWSSKFLPIPLAWKGTKAFGRFADRKNAEGWGPGRMKQLTKYASPTAWKTAWKQREELQKRRAFSQSSGELQNTLNKTIGTAAAFNPLSSIPRKLRTGKFRAYDETDYGFKKMQDAKNEYKKEIADVSTGSDYVIKQLEAAKKEGNAAKAAAAVELLTKENNLNDWSASIDDADMDSSSEKVKESLEGLFEAVGMSEEQAAKQLNQLSEVAYAAGGFGYGGMAKVGERYDERERLTKTNAQTKKERELVKDLDENESIKNPNYYMRNGEDKKNWEESKNYGKFTLTSEIEQAQKVAGKMKNVEPQALAKMLHPTTFAVEKDGEIIGMNHLVAAEALKAFNDTHERQLKERPRADFKSKVLAAHTAEKGKNIRYINNEGKIDIASYNSYYKENEHAGNILDHYESDPDGSSKPNTETSKKEPGKNSGYMRDKFKNMRD